MWQGAVVSIHVAARAGAPMQSVPSARAVPGRGLEGDRYWSGVGYYSNRPGAGRALTLIEQETLEAIAAAADGVQFSALETRRNIATADVPLNHLVDREFWIGPVRVRGVRLCEPCKYLEGLTRDGVFAALIHRGGLRVEILGEGVISVGDVIRPAER